MKLTPANITFNQSGTPTSEKFNDVYFSNANGLRESEYVFFDHNHLNNRWFSHDESCFTIMETGFGTGLNFLLTWQKFVGFLGEKCKKNLLKRLYFISTEKFPIPRDTLQQALAQWPELNEFSEQLLVQYPVATPGCHRLEFEGGAVVLDLWLGDLNNTMPSLQPTSEGMVDAWYLDGFAPGKNPDMWQDNLFRQMARLSREGATFATFTAAGIVKRGLKCHSFVVNKVKGFGTKREMLVGYFSPSESSPAIKNLKPKLGPWQRVSANLATDTPKVAVIGGGLSGANVAWALNKKGIRANVYFKDELPTAGASGNQQGGFYPTLTADFSIQSQFYSQAFGFAHRYYSELAKNGAIFGHDWCGVFFPAFSDVVRQRQLNLLKNHVWPEELIEYVAQENADALCGLHMPYDGLFIRNGGWINPSELVTSLLALSSQAGSAIMANHRLVELQKQENGWQCQWQNGTSTFADVVVLATGSQACEMTPLDDIPFTYSRGQVEHLPLTESFSAPKAVICHKGYFTPPYNHHFAMGATFNKHSRSTDVSQDDTQQNFATIGKALANCDWLERLPQSVSSRAAIRCSLPDHRPIMGAVPDFKAQQIQYKELYKALPLESYPIPDNQKNLFVLAGLGSHGLCTSPLLAEALACQISGEALPLGQELLASLNPNRFLVRELIRNQSR